MDRGYVPERIPRGLRGPPPCHPNQRVWPRAPRAALARKRSRQSALAPPFAIVCPKCPIIPCSCVSKPKGAAHDALSADRTMIAIGPFPDLDQQTPTARYDDSGRCATPDRALKNLHPDQNPFMCVPVPFEPRILLIGARRPLRNSGQKPPLAPPISVRRLTIVGVPWQRLRRRGRAEPRQCGNGARLGSSWRPSARRRA